MAQTGKTYVPISPGDRAAGVPKTMGMLPEASAQTYLKGAPVLLSSGYIREGSSVPQTIRGFARVAGQNLASDGAKNASFYVAETGKHFIGTLGTEVLTFTHIGIKALLSKSASSWFVNAATAATTASASYNCFIDGYDTTRWSIGDTSPEIIFTVIPACIQGEV